MDPNHIRNFAIIAHIDHGKSTLSDRLLELTGSVTSREMQAQVLDAMDLERERGITIKAHTVRMMYPAHDGELYQLNLIDTPGHVDFSYEVSRSLASCEGALLVVDASQGVEAQTLANAYLAISNGLEIIPVINKIDLPSADIERTKAMIEKSVGLPADDAIAVSAKTGLNVADILEAVVTLLPPPQGDPEAPLQALIFDSWFDPYKGVIVLARIINGKLTKGMKIKVMSNDRRFEVDSMGVMTPKPLEILELTAGEVGFFVATIKNVADTKVGDTITSVERPCAEPLPGFEDIKSMVFAGLYTVDSHEHAMLRDALEKLRLNDASFSFEPESSVALGFGFRCGFLGLLHLEIIQERLEREYSLDLITTAPGVRYRITLTDSSIIEVDNPSRWPDPSEIVNIEEPFIIAKILTNEEYVGNILKLVEEKRGRQQNIEYVSETRSCMLTLRTPSQRDCPRLLRPSQVRLPRLCLTRLQPRWPLDLAHGQDGYPHRWRSRRRALSHRPPRLRVRSRPRTRLKDARTHPAPECLRSPFQAAIGSKVIARETVTAIRKNVIAKCYGGDISRKRKLLEKQKEGKKRMKRIGKVDIPQEAFLAVLKVGEE